MWAIAQRCCDFVANALAPPPLLCYNTLKVGDVMGIFILVLLINVMVVCSSICILIDCKKKKFEFQNTEVLPKLAKIFSVIPLIINLVILILLGIKYDELNIFMLWGAAFAFLLCMISVAIGPATSLMGIAFSIVLTKRDVNSRKWIVYIISSCLSLLISLWITGMFFQMYVINCF